MTLPQDEEILARCFEEVSGSAPTCVQTLRPHASERRIYRLSSASGSLVGVVNASRAENDSFVALARHFRRCGLPVPAIHAYKAELGVYLEDDLGDQTLLDLLEASRSRSAEPFPADAANLYQAAVEVLPHFQIEAAATLDFSQCLSSQGSFASTLKRDIEAFLSEFVGRVLAGPPPANLAGEFEQLASFLAAAPSAYFLYRDFQARNIMVKDGKLAFIDFQSGGQGPLQYDLASLLFQSSAQIPDPERERLLESYLAAAGRHTSIDREDFLGRYPAFVVSRMLQVLSVYGRQGLGQKKEYFTRSIPLALATLSRCLKDPRMPLRLVGLEQCCNELLAATAT
jgi:aminoglycoside/choline kinase family phosphotransferase